MLKKNDIYTVEITGYGTGGEGIGRVEDIVVFVPFTVVGDVAEVRIVKTHQSYCYGKVDKLLSPSAQRVTPPCSVFGKCGGCQVMHMEYAQQLDMKRQIVQDCISRIGKLNCHVEEPIAAQQLYHYRNKIQIPVGQEKNGELVTGFYRSGSHDIVPNERCLIEPIEVETVKNTVLAWMRLCHIAPYDEQKKCGIMRHIYIRIAEGTGELMLVLVTAQKKLPCKEELLHALAQTEVKMATVVQNIQPKPTNVVLGKENIVLTGSGKIRDEVDGLQFLISPGSFYQVNTKQMVKLYQTAMRAAQIQKTDIVFDLYCGTGTISLFAARQAKKVIGVEIVPAAVQDAKENMRLCGVTNCEFHLGDAAEVTAKLYEKGERVDVVIVDPPRKGCSPEAVQLLVKLAPRKIVYISCNPATLARDLALLESQSYHTQKIQPVDLFVHSAHIETVAVVTREEEGINN